jgi:hypothetical protein
MVVPICQDRLRPCLTTGSMSGGEDVLSAWSARGGVHTGSVPRGGDMLPVQST